VKNDYSSLLETPLKTELITALSKRFKEKTRVDLNLEFGRSLSVQLKKTWMDFRGTPGTREVKFIQDKQDQNIVGGSVVKLKILEKVLQVSVTPGFHANTRPSINNKQNERRVNQLPNLHYNQNRHNLDIRATQVDRKMINGHQTNAHKQGNISKANSIYPIQNNLPGSGPTLAPKPKVQPKHQGPTVKTIYPYEAQDIDELTFSKDQIIELLQKDDSGWWQGKLGPKIGLFPANYVQEV